MSDVWLLTRLALATGVVLAPGWLVARALGVRGAAATLAWSFAIVFGAGAVTFALEASSTLTLALVLVAGAAALLADVWRGPHPTLLLGAPPAWGWIAVGGALLGLLLWHVAGEIGGDGLFHLARVRKLEAFGDLSLDAVGEFPDGGLHPGYAFPLLHFFLALVAKIAGADPAEVVLHEPTVLAPLALLVTYEAGWALFRRTSAAAATVGAALALVVFAPGHGGAYTALALPATFSRQVLAPAALALALASLRTPKPALLASTAVGSLALAVIHPTYALFLWIPFGGFLFVRWLWARRDLREGVLTLVALVVPGALFFGWLYPVVRDTAAVDPDAAERLRAVEKYGAQLDVDSATSYSLAPEVFGRSGAVAVAALLLVPVAMLAAQRRWVAFVIGGSLAVLALMLVPALFTPFSDVVSLSQARRAAGFLPFGFAFAGGLGVLAALLGPLVLPLALAGGIAFQLLYPGDFDYVLTEGGPAWATWVAVAGSVVGLAWGFLRRSPRERTAGLAAALFLLPVAVHGFWNWSPSDGRRASPLTPGLVDALRKLGSGTVFSDVETSYRIAAAAPLYVCNGPPGHVADTEDNRPYERRDEARAFLRTGDLAIPRRCGAGWLVVDTSRFDVKPGAPVVYRDQRYTMYRLKETSR